MKVISGSLKGRTIIGYNIEGTRPTMDRVKESIFAMLGDSVKNAVVLDLFAGSGNYGIEAISQGAKKVYFNDYNQKCLEVIRKNLENFNCLDKVLLFNLNYEKCLKKFKNNSIKFDLIFLDPPYNKHIIASILLYLTCNNLLNKKSLIVAEFFDDLLQDEYDNLVKIKDRSYGDKKVFIYRYIGE